MRGIRCCDFLPERGTTTPFISGQKKTDFAAFGSRSGGTLSLAGKTRRRELKNCRLSTDIHPLHTAAVPLACSFLERHAIESDTVKYLAEIRFVTTIFVNIYGLEDQLKHGGGFLLQQVCHVCQHFMFLLFVVLVLIGNPGAKYLDQYI